jgi:hypothetical protein
MKEEKKFYAKYPFVRANQALWKGNPSEPGTQFRQVVMTSDEWMTNQGMFQVYALEAMGNGIVEGKFFISPNPVVLFDDDFKASETAGEKFRQIVKEAQEQGFRAVSLFEELEFQARRRATSR